jgi:hypothetical protein
MSMAQSAAFDAAVVAWLAGGGFIMNAIVSGLPMGTKRAADVTFSLLFVSFVLLIRVGWGFGWVAAHLFVATIV